MNDRIKKAQQLLEKKHLDALIVDNPIDLYYLTSLSLSLGRLVISKDEVALFVDGRYFEACKKANPCSVYLTKGYGKESTFGSWQHLKGQLGFDAAFTSVRHFRELENVTSHLGQLVPLNDPIKELREIKDQEEIVLLKKACDLGSNGYDFVLTLLKEGISEAEVAAELEIFWKKQKGQRIAFESIIAFGENSAYPHHRSGERKLKRGDCVLIDIGVVVQNYHSDMTRVVFFGSPDPEIVHIYNIVKEAQQRALESCHSGITAKEVDRAARDFIIQEGYGSHFTHGLGHGVGLEIHELPVLKQDDPYGNKTLVDGMVVTVEPGIYLPGKGGVRIEDSIVITKQGYTDLTQRSKEILILYNE